MPSKKKTKVKTKPEDIGDLTVPLYLYSKFLDRGESDTTPEPLSSWSEWLKPKNAHKRTTKGNTADNPWVVVPDPAYIREVDPDDLVSKTHKFVPGRSRF